MRPTTPPEGAEAEPAETGQGGEATAPTEGRTLEREPAAGHDEAPAPEARTTSRKRRKTPGPETTGKTEGRRLYLSEGVHFRLRIYAYQRDLKLSEAAEEVLDKALPRWDVNRVG